MSSLSMFFPCHFLHYLCQEKVISSSSDNVAQGCSTELSVDAAAAADVDVVAVADEEEEEEVEIEMVKEISIPEYKVEVAVKEPESNDEVVVVENEQGKKVVVGAGLDAATEAAHELDLGRGVVQGRLAAVVVVVVVVVGVGVAGARGGVAGIHRGGARVSEGIGEMNLKRVCGSGLSGVVVGRVWVYILW